MLSAGFLKYGGSIKDNTAVMISFSTVSGGGVAVLTGGNFWEGAATAFYVSMLNHAAHKITENGGDQDSPKKSRSEMTSTEKDYAYMKEDLLSFNKFMLDAYLFLEGARGLWGLTSLFKNSAVTISTGAIASKGGLKPLGTASTGRTIANNLAEQMVMKQAKAQPELGTKLPLRLNDTRWPSENGWVKMQYHTKTNNGVNVVVHYVGRSENGVLKAVDDFKFK